MRRPPPGLAVVRSALASSGSVEELTMRMTAAFVLGFAMFGAPVLASDAAAIAHGEKVFAAQKCGMCHSVGGKGNKKGPLDEVGTKLTADDTRQWIVDTADMTAKAKSTRKPIMKDYSKLAEEDIKGLVAYLQSLKTS
jgi:mono/diheme cytochrome c family protein